MGQLRTPRHAYHPDLAEALLDAVRDGSTIVEACEAAHMPIPGDVMRWARELPEFASELGGALKDGALIRAERITLRAEGRGLIEDHKPKTPREAAIRDRLAFTANGFLLAMYDPITFGKRLRFHPLASPPPGRPAPTYAPWPTAAVPRLDELSDFGDLDDDEDDDDEEDTAAELRAEAAKLGLTVDDMAMLGLGPAAAEPRDSGGQAEASPDAALDVASPEPQAQADVAAAGETAEAIEPPAAAEETVAAADTEPQAEPVASPAPEDDMPAWKLRNLRTRGDRSPEAMLARTWDSAPWAKGHGERPTEWEIGQWPTGPP